MKQIFYCLCCYIGMLNAAQAQLSYADTSWTLPPKQYEAIHTNDQMTIDGKEDEAAWQNVPKMYIDHTIVGDLGDQIHTAWCKMLWDNKNVYYFIHIDEPQLWATITQNESKLFLENAFEIFLNPDGDGQQYIEYQTNALGATWDLLMDKPYRNGGDFNSSYTIKNAKEAVKYYGTLNNGKDKDSCWTVELAFPIHSIIGLDKIKSLQDKIWRMNLSRVEWTLTTDADGHYHKKLDVDGKQIPESYFTWSPQYAVNLHTPEKWGYVRFVDHLSNGNAPTFIHLDKEKRKDQLWEIYYAQKKYQQQNGQLAKKITMLNLPKNIPYQDFKLTINGKYFIIETFSKQFGVMRVNEDGLYQESNLQ